jgi:hypothetical protein
MAHKRKGPANAAAAGRGRLATGAANRIRVRQGEAKVWFYRNESSIDVYVRPADSGQNPKAASICFRISSRDFVGR